jgi:hypothetical protein
VEDPVRSGLSKLTDLYRAGARLKQEIIESDDSMTVDAAEERAIAWRQSMVDTLAPKASGQAQYVDAVPSVPAYAFPAMKSNATRRDKEALVTALGIRLGKLSEVMKDY